MWSKENSFKVLEWIIFLGLCILSTYFMKGVLMQYYSHDTSFKHSETKLEERPAIVICFTVIIENGETDYFTSRYSFGKHFNISYQNEILNIDQEQVPRNNVKEIESVVLREMSNTGSYGTCYLIVSKVQVMDPAEWKTVEVNFDHSIPEKFLPKIKFFISSLDNYYGVYQNQWWDGSVYVIDIGKYSHKKQIVVRQKKHVHSVSECNDYTFGDCYGWHLLMDDFKDCPNMCSTNIPSMNISDWERDLIKNSKLSHSLIHLRNDSIPMCETTEEIECMEARVNDLISELKNGTSCKSCSKIDYSGTLQFESENIKNGDLYYKILSYQFDYPQVLTIYEEYLIYDGIGMIGSVGGTLGMFIGFSFSNAISSALNFLQLNLNIKQNLEQHLK